MAGLEAARATIRAWRADPCRFVRDCFRVEPDAWQRQVLEAFADPAQQRIAMQACAGPGKSAVLAWCGWHFLACYGARGAHPQAAALSVTEASLRDNLWKELAKWQGQSKFLTEAFAWTQERIFAKQHAKTWFMSARSFPKTANAEEQGRTLSGLHSPYILYLIDESGDIAPSVLRSAEQGLATGPTFGKIVQAGNPTSHAGMLYAVATTLAGQWVIVRITGDPDDPQRSSRIDAEWARRQIATYGRDNPWVLAYILGQFPPASINALLSPDEVAAAMGRSLREDTYNWQAKVLGVDVAREGDDRTVLFPRQGKAAFRPAILRNATGREVAARCAKAWTEWGAHGCCFDDTGGWAGAALEHLQDAGYAPIPVNFASKAMDPRYLNKRAEMWFTMAEWIKDGGALPPVPELQAELCAVTYTFKHGKFALEEKAQVKARLGYSPDLSDALALTFAVPIAPPPTPLTLARRGAGRGPDTEYDPFADLDGAERYG